MGGVVGVEFCFGILRGGSGEVGDGCVDFFFGGDGSEEERVELVTGRGSCFVFW